MSGVALIWLWLLATAILLYLLHRNERISGILAVLLLVPLLWLVGSFVDNQRLVVGQLTVKLAGAQQFLYTHYRLAPPTQPFLAFLLIITSLFGLSWIFLGKRSAWPALTALALAALVGFATVRDIANAPWWLAITAVIAAVMIQGGQPGNSIAGQRTLLFPVLAVPLFLALPHFLGQAALDPVHHHFLQTAYFLMAATLLLLSNAFPLHGARPAQGKEGYPPGVAFWWIASEAAWLYLFQQTTNLWPGWWQATHMSTILLWVGLLSIGWAGFAGFFNNHLGLLWSYAALAEWGAILVLVSREGSLTMGLLWLFLSRALALVGSSSLLAVVARRKRDLSMMAIRGLTRHLPLTLAALFIALLSLLGAPLTLGFGPHWMVYQTLQQQQLAWGMLFLVTTFGLSISVLRATAQSVEPLPLEAKSLLPESRSEKVLALLVMGGILAGFVYTSAFAPLLRWALAALLST